MKKPRNGDRLRQLVGARVEGLRGEHLLEVSRGARARLADGMAVLGALLKLRSWSGN